MSEASPPGLRLDVWLWRARFFKTRAKATEYVTRKGVRLTRHGQTRKIDKAGARVVPGDIVTLYQARRIISAQIEALGERRGPAAEAQALYSLGAEET